MLKNLVGQLWYRENVSMIQAIYLANKAFAKNVYLSGLVPHEVHVNPQDKKQFGIPDSIEVVMADGLTRKLLPVLESKQVQRDHVLICCPDPDVWPRVVVV